MKLLLFDLDGTLITTGGAGIRSLDLAFETLHGIPRAMDGISPAGMTDPLIVRDVFVQKIGRPPVDGEVQRVCEQYLRHLPVELQKGQGYCVIDGIPELLEKLSKREDLVLALGTGNWEEGARIKLEPAGLNKYFAVGGFGSDAAYRPDMLRAGIRRAEARAGRTFSLRDVFVIGDTVLDVRAGKAVGAVTVAVACGHGKPPELLAETPDIFLISFLKPDALLERL